MIEITSDKIVTPELEQGAVYNDEYIGFHLDYLVLHCLLKIYKPQRFLEVGTNMGTGTKVIKNALGEDAEVFSLDLPTELAHTSLQHQISEGKMDSVGHRCDLPFTQLRGDSLKFDYSSIYPINGWYIDGEHNYDHPNYEATEAIKSDAELIIFHDANIECVWKAIEDAFNGNKYYEIIRVIDCRIAYAHKINKK